MFKGSFLGKVLFVHSIWFYICNLDKKLNLEVSWYSLEQYIGCIIRQAFNYYCSLLQVWREAEDQALKWDLEA